MPASLSTVALAFGLVAAQAGEPTVALLSGMAGVMWQVYFVVRSTLLS